MNVSFNNPYSTVILLNHGKGGARRGRKSISSSSGNYRIEFIITKKLILISTVHILLNLPRFFFSSRNAQSVSKVQIPNLITKFFVFNSHSYVMRLKIFINDPMTTDEETTDLITIIQQYSMVNW